MLTATELQELVWGHGTRHSMSLSGNLGLEWRQDEKDAVIPCSFSLLTSKKWHLEWPLKENTERQLESERQRGMPAKARTEGTVTWVNLLCDLGPTLFVFRVTSGHFSHCSLSVTPRLTVGSVAFLAAWFLPHHLLHWRPQLALLLPTTLVALRQLAAVSCLPASLLSDRWGGPLLTFDPFNFFTLQGPSTILLGLERQVTLSTELCSLSISAWQIHRHLFSSLRHDCPSRLHLIWIPPYSPDFLFSSIGSVPFIPPGQSTSLWFKCLISNSD